jgi:hypothetical protein
MTIHIGLHGEFMERQLCSSYFDNSCATADPIHFGNKPFRQRLALVSRCRGVVGTVNDTKGNKTPLRLGSC